MKYLCLIYIDEQAFDRLTASEQQACFATHLAHDAALRRSGQLIASEKLAPARSAVTVQRRAGKLAVACGPFAETREQLGGFLLVAARDLNDAIRIASRIPQALSGTIEVRPIAPAAHQPEAAHAPSRDAATKYLCLICYEERMLDELPEAEWSTLAADNVAYHRTLQQSGRLIVAHELGKVHSATLVRMRGGRLSVSDGPYAETKEQIGGFILYAAPDADDAIRVASRVPVARIGKVEVRAVHSLDPYPQRSDRP